MDPELLSHILQNSHDYQKPMLLRSKLELTFGNSTTAEIGE